MYYINDNVWKSVKKTQIYKVVILFNNYTTDFVVHTIKNARFRKTHTDPYGVHAIGVLRYLGGSPCAA